MQDQSWRALKAEGLERVLVRAGGPSAFTMIAVTTVRQQWGMLIGWTVFAAAVAVVRASIHRFEDRQEGAAGTGGIFAAQRSRLSGEALIVLGWAAAALVGLPLVAWWLPVLCVAAGVVAASPLVRRVHHDRGTAALVLLLGDQSTGERMSQLARLSDEDLCSLWSRTSRRSLRRGLRHATASYSLVRGALLDEMELRDPDAFASWLREGRAGDPAPFLRRTSRSRPENGSA